jgi:cytochrome c oxidase subunit 2
MHRLPFVFLTFALVILLPACARQAANLPAVETPAVVIADQPVAAGAPEVAPPPRLIPFAAEPSDTKDAMEVYVIRGANGAWKVQYPPGQRLILGGTGKLTAAELQRLGKLILPVNRAVTFTVSVDGPTASFEILRFGVAATAAEGKWSHATVKPTRTGEYAIRSGRERVGTALVVSAQDFDDWLNGFYPERGDNPVDGSVAHDGRQLFLKLQCSRCHSTPNAKGPALEELYGSKVQLKGGGAEIADQQYIIESIRKPKAKVVEDWEPIMPAYDKTQATAEELNALVAYIRSLKKGAPEPKERLPAPFGAPTERTKPPPPKGDQPRLEPIGRG